MEAVGYYNLIRLFNGLEHSMVFLNANDMPKPESTRPFFIQLYPVALDLLRRPSWSTSDEQLDRAWKRGIGSFPLLGKNFVRYDEISAQKELLYLLYCLASLNMVIAENDPAFVAERKRNFVVVKRLATIAKEGEFTSKLPEEILREINTRLDDIISFIGRQQR